MSHENYQPYRNIRTTEDLLLIRECFDGSPPAVLDVPKGHYCELFLWLDLDGPLDDLFSTDGETLLVGEADADSQGWRLSLTPHGYLRFESGEGEKHVQAESRVPLLAFLQDNQPFRVGLSISNYAQRLRGTGYEAESTRYNRVRLHVAPAADAPLAICGGVDGFCVPELASVPHRLHFSDDVAPAFRGRIRGVTAYNTHYVEMFNPPGLPSADEIIPPIPGGGGFCARWTAENTIEVFGRPDFSNTGTYWFLLKIADETNRLRTLHLQPVWSGAANMTPTYFISTDGDHWERIVPEKIEMREDSTHFSAWLNLSEEQARGCYLSSAIPFLPRHREAFLEWVKSKHNAHITVPGKSVEGRDVPVVRVGPDDPERFHAVFICGQHSPAEIMGAHILRPMIEEAQKLQILDRCTFHLVPTLNVDCAHYGGNGLNAAGRNTNRHWFNEIQPENQAVIDYLKTLHESGCKVGFGMDLHAGGIWRNHVLMSAQPTEDMPLSEAFLAHQEEWFATLEEFAGLQRRDRAILPHQTLRATDLLMYLFHCPAFCLEFSYCSYFDPELKATRVFSQECLDMVGRGIARAIARQMPQD